MMARKPHLDAHIIKYLFDYDPHKGDLYWRHRDDRNAAWNGKWAGNKAGHIDHHGYVIVGIDAKNYKAHRLIWTWMTGTWPCAFIDHQDGNKSNNKWENLRAATKSQNGANRSILSNNTSGYKGVTWDISSSKWLSQIRVNGRTKYLGRFENIQIAAEAYVNAAREFFGDFACSDNLKKDKTAKIMGRALR